MVLELTALIPGNDESPTMAVNLGKNTRQYMHIVIFPECVLQTSDISL